ncbi:MAG: hypothetical protein EBU90_05320 [Proteobacteria bacterium]|nr:hypothetical protein [Pseudomonadota bacterium]
MKLLLGLLFLGNSLLITAMDKAEEADLPLFSFDVLFRIIAEAQEGNEKKVGNNNNPSQDASKKTLIALKESNGE